MYCKHHACTHLYGVQVVADHPELLPDAVTYFLVSHRMLARVTSLFGLEALYHDYTHLVRRETLVRVVGAHVLQAFYRTMKILLIIFMF